ncbi:glycosyl transferase family 2 [Rhodovulum imhoffii]|uniref:Glycosyl transferase family 2 n=1 Tax=Rhodovulum imhoffii TaxID=365340 RepID=A0A2T5BPA6_9RHOB|nr:glycosyltransferase family 2 protein [Rhodovulum imhoffii]MBK5932920.1 glycosyl transferase family 2 [Rhodovulum imhoffii]PTN00856.1 glycosyl transferase family 2 [Rhodovulum imhoffii]
MTKADTRSETSALRATWTAGRMHARRYRLLSRALRKRRQIRPVTDRTAQIRPADILCFSTVRNEATRLPFFLDYHRAQGVRHFLMVDNDSTDETRDYLAGQPDVSLWHTAYSYRLSRFGMDWLTWLQFRHGHGHWCLTLDADELLVYPHHDSRSLQDLTGWLDSRRTRAFGAIMLDLYPKGRLGAQNYRPGQNPLEVLRWFDEGNIFYKYQPNLQNLLVRGGVRRRVFFHSAPERSPTLSKTPLVRWHRRYVYVSSTHSVLPRWLNHVRGDIAGDPTSGVILHTKFLPEIVGKSRIEKRRREHFANSILYNSYYDGLMDDPVLWGPQSCEYEDWQQLERLGLLSRGGWM